MSTENFTGRAEAYAKGRPGYPKAAVDYICSCVPHHAVFADIGAGTRMFTERLAERGYAIYAVEPNADMRGQLVSTLVSYPSVTIVDGTGESTSLPNNSVDVITIAHALHWFDINAFREECHRILKPNRLIIAVYNLLSDGSGEMITLSKQATDAFFHEPIVIEFPNTIEYTRDRWLAYITSLDDTPLPTDPNYDAHAIEVNAGFDRDSTDGILTINRVTKMYSERML
jgi:ubiquinone/menaquinone biosynthesis C-methylase UbiE